MGGAGWATVFCEAMLTVFVAFLVYYKYASHTIKNFRTKWYLPLVVILGWSFSFAVVWMVANDIAATRYEGFCLAEVHNETHPSRPFCAAGPPSTYISSGARRVIWAIIYWTVYVSTWLLYPILLSYVLAGEFHFIHKLRRALIENAIFYAVAGAIAAVIVVILFFTQTNFLFNVIAAGAAIGNTYGLFLLIIFGGAGFVQVPRALLWRSNDIVRIKFLRFQLVNLTANLKKDRDNLHTLLQRVKQYDISIRQGHIYRKYIDIIIAKCEKLQLDHRVVEADGDDDPSYAQLSSLNASLTSAQGIYQANSNLYDAYLKDALKLEDILAAKAHAESRGEREWKINWLQPGEERVGFLTPYLVKAEYIWYIWMRKYSLLFLFGVTCVFSFLALWSEALFSSRKVTLSIPALLLGNTKTMSSTTLQFFSIVCLGYIAMCAYYTMFNVRVFWFYRLVPNGHTNPNSLLYCVAYCSRLIAPLAYNFLYVAHWADDDGDRYATAFEQVMGDFGINSIPILSADWFHLYVPLAFVLVVFLILANVHKKIIGCFADTFEFDDDFDHDFIDEGKNIVARERRKIQGLPEPDESRPNLRAALRRAEGAHSPPPPKLSDRIGTFFSSIRGGYSSAPQDV